jgi:hypothetical protein
MGEDEWTLGPILSLAASVAGHDYLVLTIAEYQVGR